MGGLAIKLLLLLLSSTTGFGFNKSCSNSQALLSLPGDVIITAIFDGHHDSNCSTPIKTGLDQIKMVEIIMKMLRDSNYIPNIQIGLLVYDGCSSSQRAHQAVVDAMVNIECQQAVTLGIVTTRNIASYISTLVDQLKLSITVIAKPLEGKVTSTLAASLAAGLGWTSVDQILTPDDTTTSSFLEAATEHRICVHSVNTLSENMNIDGESVIAIGNWKDIKNVHGASADMKMIYVPLDEPMDIKPDNFPECTYIILPSNIYHSYRTSENKTEKCSVQVPVFVQLAADILQIVDSFKLQLSKNCVNLTICDSIKSFHSSILAKPVLQDPQVIHSVMNLFEIEEANFAVFHISQNRSKDDGFYEQVGFFNFNNDKLSLSLYRYNDTTPELCKSNLSDNTTGKDCSNCTNYVDAYKQYYEQQYYKDVLDWRSESWVAAVISVSCVGVLCCFSIAIFMVIRVCKNDVLEGNPSFSLLLILAIVCMYCSILPFAFKVLNKMHFFNSLICTLKIFGTNLSYSFMYSIMLARSFMLASCDQDGGFMSHVNGYLQTFLCFFIALVQIALSIQFLAIDWNFLNDDQCFLMTKGYYFISFLSYNMFLLFLLVCMAPFIFKSKRNYKEGMFFFIAIFLCLLIWIGWCTAFLLLPEEMNDLSVVVGLAGTASAVLISVFIPRTYLMTIGIVREHLASALPSIAYNSNANIAQVNYRSTQALYDSVNTITSDRGQSNPNYYCARSTTPATAKMDSVPRIRVVTDNTYERYGTPPSPLNVTRF